MDAVIVDGPAIDLIRVGARTIRAVIKKGRRRHPACSLSKPLRDVIAAFSFSDPTPGGGSASALASSLGASLLHDGGRACRRRATSRTTIVRRWRSLPARSPASSTSSPRRSTPTAPRTVRSSTAYRQPKANDAEKSARQGGDRARAAAGDRRSARRDAPVGRRAQAGQAVAAHGHRAASSDVGVALALLQAGLEGARLNVDVNLGGISDRAYVEAVTAESSGWPVRCRGWCGTRSRRWDRRTVELGSESECFARIRPIQFRIASFQLWRIDDVSVDFPVEAPRILHARRESARRACRSRSDRYGDPRGGSRIRRR